MREQSFEEMRLRYYEAVSMGIQNRHVQQAQALYNQSVRQIDIALHDLDGAVQYVLDGEKEHPNRSDVMVDKSVGFNTTASSFARPGPAFQSNTTTTTTTTGFGRPFGQPPQATQSANGFGRPPVPVGGQPAQTSSQAQASAFGRPSSLAQGGTGFGNPSFGQPSMPSQHPSALNQTAGGFGQPSMPQQPSNQTAGGLGQPSGFGQRQQPAFGQPSMPQQPSAPNQTAGGFGRPSGLGQRQQPTFGQPSMPQQSSALNQTGGFGQPSGLGRQQQPAFGQPSALGLSPFGKPAAPSPFSQLASQKPSGFGQQSSTASPFGQLQQQQQQQQQPGPGPGGPGQEGFGRGAAFGRPTNNTFGQPPATTTSSANEPTAHPGPPPVIKVDSPEELNPIPLLNGQTRRDPMSQKLLSWKGQQVQYINNGPCYLHPQDRKTWVRIFFPDGPPNDASLKDAHGKPDEYTDQIAEQYEFFLKNGAFKNYVLPSVPPKREWVSFDF